MSIKLSTDVIQSALWERKYGGQEPGQACFVSYSHRVCPFIVAFHLLTTPWTDLLVSSVTAFFDIAVNNSVNGILEL
jgi:hypothetical protein